MARVHLIAQVRELRRQELRGDIISILPDALPETKTETIRAWLAAGERGTKYPGRHRACLFVPGYPCDLNLEEPGIEDDPDEPGEEGEEPGTRQVVRRAWYVRFADLPDPVSAALLDRRIREATCTPAEFEAALMNRMSQRRHPGYSNVPAEGYTKRARRPETDERARLRRDRPISLRGPGR